MAEQRIPKDGEVWSCWDDDQQWFCLIDGKEAWHVIGSDDGTNHPSKPLGKVLNSSRTLKCMMESRPAFCAESLGEFVSQRIQSPKGATNG